MTPPSFSSAIEPQLAIDADHEVYIAYGMGDAIYVSTSKDEGQTYAEPIKVAASGKLSLGMRRGPRITVHDGIVTVTATYGEQGGGRDGDLLAFRSSDHGKTWSKAVRVNDVGGAGREGLHAMAAAPDGTIACTWLDLRTKGTKLFLAVSKDGGATWSPNRLVYASPSGSICQCCVPSIAYDSSGKLAVMFRNLLDGFRDMYVTTSFDNGLTFTSPIKQGQGTWQINACPMDGGSFAFSDRAAIVAVWRRESTLYRSVPSGSERVIGDGKQPAIATGVAGEYVVWTDGPKLMASTPTEQKFELSSNGGEASITTSPDRKLVLATWAANGIQAGRLP